ncbi:MAG: hypothetical protein JWN25_3190 [Verrucomicrobiales bacterium]|nr:hypothetical protein [Verrucomicrobiales bacterium]
MYMNALWVKVLSISVIITGLSVAEANAENLAMFNGAIMRDGKMLIMKDGDTTPMEKDLIMSNGATVSKDGKVKLKGAKTTTLKEGQIVQMDGMIRLMKPGMERDHVMVKDGKLVLVKDGKATIVEEDMTMSNGTVITKSGSYTTSDGKTLKLKDNEKMRMDGKVAGTPMEK